MLLCDVAGPGLWLIRPSPEELLEIPTGDNGRSPCSWKHMFLTQQVV